MEMGSEKNMEFDMLDDETDLKEVSERDEQYLTRTQFLTED
jgi:hypothetical protein